MVAPGGGGRPRAQGRSPRGVLRTLQCEEAAGAALGEGPEGPEGADARARELQDRLELELLQQGEEQYECILKRKEQHVAEVPARGEGREPPPTNLPPAPASAQQRASLTKPVPALPRSKSPR